jgi:hypothetical protein
MSQSGFAISRCDGAAARLSIAESLDCHAGLVPAISIHGAERVAVIPGSTLRVARE